MSYLVSSKEEMKIKSFSWYYSTTMCISTVLRHLHIRLRSGWVDLTDIDKTDADTRSINVNRKERLINKHENYVEQTVREFIRHWHIKINKLKQKNKVTVSSFFMNILELFFLCTIYVDRGDWFKPERKRFFSEKLWEAIKKEGLLSFFISLMREI